MVNKLAIRWVGTLPQGNKNKGILEMAHILFPGGVHILLNNKPVLVARSDKHYDLVVAALKDKKTDAEILEIIESERRRVEEATQITPDMTVQGGRVLFRGQPVDSSFNARILQMLDEGFPLTAMSNFQNSLDENPSNRAKMHLYPFLEHGKIPLTEEGNFLAFKAVAANFTDRHSGRFNNSVGEALSMPRNQVDDDPHRTCSHGFHVCSFDYLRTFAAHDGHVMVVEVNPRDVVAIPIDYHNTKMRVCAYKVVGENLGYYTDPRNTLGDSSVASAELPFAVEVRLDEEAVFVERGAYSSLKEAREAATMLREDTFVESTRIRNAVSDCVLEQTVNDEYVGDPEYVGDDADTDRVDDGFSLVGYHGENRVDLGSDYDSEQQAVSEALDFDGYDRIEVFDMAGNLVRTLS
jgi:hypothetical protein